MRETVCKMAIFLYTEDDKSRKLLLKAVSLYAKNDIRCAMFTYRADMTMFINGELSVSEMLSLCYFGLKGRFRVFVKLCYVSSLCALDKSLFCAKTGSAVQIV